MSLPPIRFAACGRYADKVLVAAHPIDRSIAREKEEYVKISEGVLAAAGPSRPRLTVNHALGTIHFSVDTASGLAFLVFTASVAEGFKQRRAFGFLDAYKTQFISELAPQAATCAPLALTGKANRFTTRLMESHAAEAADKIALVQSQVSATADVVHSNIDAILANGARLDGLVSQSAALEGSAALFAGQARSVKRAARARRIKLAMALTAVVLIVLAAAYIYIVLPYIRANQDTTGAAPTAFPLPRPRSVPVNKPAPEMFSGEQRPAVHHHHLGRNDAILRSPKMPIPRHPHHALVGAVTKPVVAMKQRA
jgi:hypothetical protein